MRRAFVTGATPLTAVRSAALARDGRSDAAARRTESASKAPARISLSLFGDLDAVATQWRRFETVADCTPFQTFDWLSGWQRHIGSCSGVRPAIGVGTFADGTTAFIWPLAVETERIAPRLCWLGQDLNDYNAPLLAPDFSQRVPRDGFVAAWNEFRARLRRDPLFRYAWIELEKMPQTIGGQDNPFFQLAVAPNPSGAHITQLGSDWNSFYTAKRSSATRRRDRIKRKRLSASGEVSFHSSADAGDRRRTLETLMRQKNRLLEHRGIADMFAQPGWRAFFLDMAENPNVHISRVQVGESCAAANFGLVFGDTYYHMLASYDDGELSRFGPGALHLRELLAYATGLGLRRFDFTIGDEPYKMEWSDRTIRLADYAKAASWRGWPAWCLSALRRPLKRFVKQTPWAWRAASAARATAGRLLRPSAPAPNRNRTGS